MRKILLSLVFMAVCVPLVFAQPERQPTRDELILQKLNEINKSLEEIKTSVNKDLSDARKDIETLKKTTETLAAETKKLRDSVHTQVKDSEERVGIPLKGANPPDATQYAKIKIVNEYPTTQTVIVNKDNYKVDSGQTKTIDYIMPGEFTYRVVGIHDTDLKRTINPNQVYTITIFPQK